MIFYVNYWRNPSGKAPVEKYIDEILNNFVNLGSDLTIDIWKVFGAWPSVAEAYPSAIVRSAEVQKHRRAKELKKGVYGVRS